MKTTHSVRLPRRFWPGKAPAPAAFAPGLTVPPAAPPRGGYTIIEMIAALAIMVILAAMIVPVVINQTEIAAVNAETTSLSTLNNGLVFGVQHNFQIPSAANWAPVLAQLLGMPTTSITTNGRGYGRIYVYDTNGFGSLTLPYIQTHGLAALPANPRLMLLSSVSTNLPDVSGPLSTTEFNAIWNTAPGDLPATWTTNYWHGKAADLVIQRINLLPLFSQVVLSAVDTNGFGNFVIQSGTNISAATYVITNFPSSAWYLQGTVIALYDTNRPPAQNLESQFVINGCNSWVFEDQAWRGALLGWGTNGPAAWFSSLTINSGSTTNLNAIVESQNYVGCEQSCKTCAQNPHDPWISTDGDSCQSLCDCFDSCMQHYNAWCNQGYNTGNDSANSQLSQDLYQLNDVASDFSY